jgi:NADPH2:quinone reductase
MKIVQIPVHGAPEVLELVDSPVPEPAAGEVLVRVLAVSINHLDLWVRRGMPGMPIPLPRVPGSDGTGEVVACGAGVEGFAPGDRVMILPGVSSGTSKHDLEGNDHLSDDYGIRGEHCDGICAEYAALEARYLLKLPDGLDPISTAAAPLVFLTAWGMLVTRARLEAGEEVLVIGGASGVGSAAIQIAADRGARVIATAGSPEKRELARELGAAEVLDHRDPAWPKEVKRLTAGRGVDVVVEHVGPATWKGSVRSLARRGRLVTCGATTGPEVSVLLPHLFMKNLSLLGSTMGPRSSFPTIVEKLASGTWRPVVDRVMPLSEVVLAHRSLENGEVRGKIVLTPGS